MSFTISAGSLSVTASRDEIATTRIGALRREHRVLVARWQMAHLRAEGQDDDG